MKRYSICWHDEQALAKENLCNFGEENQFANFAGKRIQKGMCVAHRQRLSCACRSLISCRKLAPTENKAREKVELKKNFIIFCNLFRFLGELKSAFQTNNNYQQTQLLVNYKVCFPLIKSGAFCE
jgi:prolyl oligopeptidase PreP (S9A serine peptidase family)